MWTTTTPRLERNIQITTRILLLENTTTEELGMNLTVGHGVQEIVATDTILLLEIANKVPILHIIRIITLQIKLRCLTKAML